MKYHVLIGTHHKTGTVWMSGVFREISYSLAVPYLDVNDLGACWHDIGQKRKVLRDFTSEADRKVIIFDGCSHFPDLSVMDPEYKVHFRGIRMIRDPRDVAISAASYHARASEPWLHVPQDKFGGLTYQQKNRSFSTLKEKILFELDNSHHRLVRQMASFNAQGVFCDVKYEHLIDDTSLTAWRKVLSYLGFEENELEPALEAVAGKSLFAGGQHHDFHVTSGAKEQWRDVFDADLLEQYTNRFGAELVRLGYPLVPPSEPANPKLSNETEAANATAAVPFKLQNEIEAKLKQFEAAEVAYNRLVQRIRQIMATALPAEAIVLVVSKGDRELVEPGSRRVWHFPQTGDGLYWNGNPADSTDAVSQLEALRRKGAGFLLLPSTEFWWLDYYNDFSRHLDKCYSRILKDEYCIVYDLGTSTKEVAHSSIA
jgi:hypothetical protein